MKTTVARAKEIKPRTEKLVTLGRRQTLASLRILNSRLPEKSASKMYYEIAPRYKDKKGGYLRIVKLMGARKRDAAFQVLIEFVK